MNNPRSARPPRLSAAARPLAAPEQALPAVQLRAIATRDALLAAGRSLLATRDFDALSVAELAAAHQLSVGSFYGRFRDKESFFAVLQQQVMDQWLELADVALQPVRGGACTAAQAVERFCATVVDVFRADAGFFRSALRHETRHPESWPPIKDTGARIAQHFTDALAPLLPHLTPDDRQLRTRFAVQMLYGTCANAVLHDPGPLKLADPRLAPELARVICASLGLAATEMPQAPDTTAPRGTKETRMKTIAARHRTRGIVALAAAWLVGASGLLVAPPAAQAQGSPVTLRFASNAPAKSPWAVQIDRLAAKIAEESKGTVKIEPFYGGQLGNEQDTLQQILRGRIDMGAFSTGAMSLVVPEVNVLILPMYFRTVAEQDCVIDRHLLRPFEDLVTARGMKLLGMGEVGNIDLAGKKPYVNVADVRGTKATSYSKMQATMWTALGANPVFLGVPEWASSMQTGMVDFIGPPMALYVPSGLNKIAPVLSRVSLWNSSAFTVINKATWDKLSAEQRAAVDRALVVENATLWRREIRGMEGKLREAHVAGGGTMVEPTAEQRAAWRAALTPTWAEVVKALGGQSEALFKTVESALPSCRS
jgi:TRAP-type transport system periplasmic protein